MRIRKNTNTEYIKTLLSDPAALAVQVEGWREGTGFTQAEAAYFLDVPVRTLQGIEQGRGFRYPTLLWNAMRNIEVQLKAVQKYTPEQLLVALRETGEAAKRLKQLKGTTDANAS